MKVSKVATVVSTKRLNNSSMGNPAWEFTFDDGSTHRTSSNASFSYEVTESNFNGQMVNVYMTRAGRIIDMRKAAHPSYVCTYLTSPTSTARASYNVPNLAVAMSSHNAALPQYSTKVLKWEGPTGITFHTHDSELSL